MLFASLSLVGRNKDKWDPLFIVLMWQAFLSVGNEDQDWAEFVVKYV